MFNKLYPGLDSWKELPSYVKKVPEKYGKHINANKGVGVKWKFKREGKIHEVRIDKAQQVNKFESQKMDHVSVTIGNKVVDKTGKNYIFENTQQGTFYKIKIKDFESGKTIEKYRFDKVKKPRFKDKPSTHPDSHISVKDWMQWKDIFKPE